MAVAVLEQTMKTCTQCEVEKPISEFSKDGRTKDGICGECKVCRAEYQQQYRKTESGKATSARGCKKYQKSDRGKISKAKADEKYRGTENGKQTAAKKNKKYYQAIKGCLHSRFWGVMQRCTDPQHRAYKYYGGRGVEVRFGSVDEFIDYVMNDLQIDPRGLEIHRIDNDGHYEPGNIEWLTRAEHRAKHDAMRRK